MKYLIILLLIVTPCAGQSAKLLAAIRQVESGGNDKAVGDNGKAIGPYQIHKVYWQDAVDFDKKIGGSYQDCYEPEYAERVVRAYMRRYAPKNSSDEVFARIHNGGPKGASRKATKPYWDKVKKLL